MIVTYHVHCDICKKHFADQEVNWPNVDCQREENAGGICEECFDKIQKREIIVNEFGEWKEKGE